MAYADAANYNRIKSMKAYAVGTILPWSGAVDSIPTGWRICDGSSLEASSYPLLFECIGTIYGGSVTVSGDILTGRFALPNINGNGIVDIWRGHHEWLNGTNPVSPRGEAHRPETTRITDPTGTVLDEFWNRYPNTGADRPTEFSGNYTSDFDLVGRVRNTALNTLSADVTGVSLEGGEYEDTVFVVGRKLSDAHMRSHRHGLSGWNPDIQTNSLRPKTGAFMDTCAVQLQSDIFCSTSVVCTAPNEPNAMEIPGGQNNEYGVSWFLSPNNYREGTGFGFIAPTGSSGIPPNMPNFVPGGGGIGNGTQRTGDGRSVADMYSHLQWRRDYPSGLTLSTSNSSVTPTYNQRNFQTNLSNTEVTWSTVVEHDHGTSELSFVSRLRATSSYTWNDIRMGTVNIINTSGEGVGVININTYTPTLVMPFIIRVF